MKNIFVLLFLSHCFLLSTAQQTLPHSHEMPPQHTPFVFKRGMMIDCADEIIRDVANGNNNQLKQELIDFIQQNSISYIAMKGLDNSAIFGDPFLENGLRELLRDLHSSCPLLQIAVAAGANNNFSEKFIAQSDQFAYQCDPKNLLKRNTIDSLVNSSNDPEMTKRIIRFFSSAIDFSFEKSASRTSWKCMEAFDCLFLENRYWQNINYSVRQMKSAFAGYLSILMSMQNIKCVNSCIQSVDAEFLPTEQYISQGWSATDQIEMADPLIDRMIVPAFTNDIGTIYDGSSHLLHLFTDRFSKDGTKYFIGLSAESPWISYCDNSGTGQNYLGDYLNTTGNMYTVEKEFSDQLLDPAYICQWCNCNVSADNYYTSVARTLNKPLGSFWYSYSFMKDYQLYRSQKTEIVNETSENISKYFDLLGRPIDQSSLIQEMPYIKMKLNSDGTQTRKLQFLEIW